MRIRSALAVLAVSCLSMAPTAQANNGQGFGPCKTGFSDSTLVRTELRGDLTIGQVQVNDRVWSFNESVGRPGWSKVLRRVDAGPSYKLLSDFTEPGSSVVTKACWIIRRPA